MLYVKGMLVSVLVIQKFYQVVYSFITMFFFYLKVIILSTISYQVAALKHV